MHVSTKQHQKKSTTYRGNTSSMAKYFFRDEILFGILQNHFPGVVLYWEILPKYSSEIKFEFQNHPQIMILHTKI